MHLKQISLLLIGVCLWSGGDVLAAESSCAPLHLTPAPVKQVLIVPGFGGPNPADLLLMNSLCTLGFKASVLNGESNFFVVETDYAVHDRAVNRFLLALQQKIELNPEPTVLIGSSLGGMLVPVAFSQNDQLYHGLLRGMVTVVAGGPLSDVVEESVLPQLQYLNFYREFVQYPQLTATERHQSLIQNIKLDPFHLAKPQLAARCLMFIADLDVIVPTQTQIQLWNAWGQPQVQHLLTDHVGGILWVYSLKAQQISLFIANLK